MKILPYILEFHWTQNFELWMIKFCFVAFFMSIALFVLWQKKEFVYVGAPNHAKWRDLRLWALAILLMQTFIYICL